MLTIKSVSEAEKFIQRQKRLGSDVRWDNYDIVFFRAAEHGVYSKDGAFRNGVWGFENRSPVTERGTWEIDFRNVRRPEHPRN